MRKPTKTNSVLITIIGAMALALVVKMDTGSSQAAWAQQPQTEPPFNATEQRKQMISALSQINTRLTAIETKLSTGLTVKVTEMPPVVIKDQAKK